MIAHDHVWAPVAGERGCYACACGAQGHRPARGGAVVASKQPRAVEAAPTAAPSELARGSYAMTDGYGGVRAFGRIVDAAPTLDEQERWSR